MHATNWSWSNVVVRQPNGLYVSGINAHVYVRNTLANTGIIVEDALNGSIKAKAGIPHWVNRAAFEYVPNTFQ